MFKLGERVFDIKYGWGIVVCTDSSTAYPVMVEFENKDEIEYTEDGREYSVLNRSLYHHDYTPTEQLPLKSSPELLREKFAGMAMQGILSGTIRQLLGDDITSDRIACFAVLCADELIKALNEKP